MLDTFLSYVSAGLVVNVVIFSATLIFSQKIKDFINGVPAHSRTAIMALEASVLAKVKTYEQDLVSGLMPKPVTAAVTAAPVASPVVDPPKAV